MQETIISLSNNLNTSYLTSAHLKCRIFVKEFNSLQVPYENTLPKNLCILLGPLFSVLPQPFISSLKPYRSIYSLTFVIIVVVHPHILKIPPENVTLFVLNSPSHLKKGVFYLPRYHYHCSSFIPKVPSVSLVQFPFSLRNY